MTSEIAPATGSSLADVIERLTARVQAGEPIDEAALIAENPGHADELRQLLPAIAVLAELSEARAADGAAPVRAASDVRFQLGVLGDYRIIREVGRGGMGVVYEAEQISLRRRVALKVLPFAAIMDPRQLQRFKNEALAAASLDHPHVVKVFGVGCERGVHFIALQFVDGQSLADLIRERREGPLASPTVGQDPTRTYTAESTATGRKSRQSPGGSRTPLDAAFISRAVQWGIDAAEALEHAHVLGIVHRDVKPGNLLVDGRGEVFVADFGLAKVAADPGVTGSADLLGTLRYMSPEQAGAKHDLVDHRSDIYSLGVTLYELLTLTSAFDGPDRESILSKVTTAEPTALRELDRRIPRDLETVILKAMEKDPARRYSSAKELAADLRRFLGSEPVQAKRTGPIGRTQKWARRNRPAVVAASVILLAIVAATAGGIGWVLRDEAQRRREADNQVDAGIAQVEDLYARRKYSAAREAISGLEPLLRSGVTQNRKYRIETWRADLDMVERLTTIRSERAAVGGANDRPDPIWASGAYTTAFREYGVDVVVLETNRAAELIRVRPIAAELAAALDDWALATPSVEEFRRLTEIAVASDPDPARLRIREAVLRRDRAELRKLAESPGTIELPPPTLVLLASALEVIGEPGRVDVLLKRSHHRYPEDFWFNQILASRALRCDPPEYVVAARFLAAAVASRPQDVSTRLNLGFTLGKMFLTHERETAVREVIRLKPDYAPAYCLLGESMFQSGRRAEAEASYREAIRLRPNLAAAHMNLGYLLEVSGRHAESEACYRETIRIRPDHQKAHCSLGALLVLMERFEEADETYREAIRIKPDPDSHYLLGNLLVSRGRQEEAEASFREAIRLKPDLAQAHYDLGNSYRSRGQLVRAYMSYSEAIRIQPANPTAHLGLGTTRSLLGRHQDAEASYREAIRLKPSLAEAHCRLGESLREQGRFEESFLAYRLGHELGIKQKEWQFPSAQWMKNAERLVALNTKLPVIVAGKARPSNVKETVELAEVAMLRKWYAASARFYKDALLLDPQLRADFRGARYNAACAAILSSAGRGQDPERPNDNDRAQMRLQGLTWLREDLVGLSQLAGEAPEAIEVRKVIRHWAQDPDLSPVRDEGELMKLPPEEQAEWRKLWTEVGQLRDRLAPALAPPPRVKEPR